MLRHTVLLALRDDAPPDRAGQIVEHVKRLPALIDTIRTYYAAVDLGLNPETADVCIVAEFDDFNGYATYRDHPAHQAVIAEHIAPYLERRTAIQS